MMSLVGAKTAVGKDGSITQVAPVQVEGLYLPHQTINPLEAPMARGVEEEGITSYHADGNGNVITTELDQRGQAISSVDGEGILPNVARNAENLVTSRVNGRGHKTSYSYDERGNIIRQTETIALPLSFGEAVPYPLDLSFPSGQRHAVGSDVNNDGNLDITIAGSHELTLLENAGDGTFISTDVEYGGQEISVLASADLDDDGDDDLVVAVFEGYGYGGDSILVLPSKGDGSFESPTSAYTTDQTNNSIAIGDLNGDGKADLASHSNDGIFNVWYGNGDGTFGERQQQTFNTSLSNLVIADFDDDGYQDLASTGTGVIIWRNNGDGSF